MALSNRFSEDVFAFWCDWYTDLIDFKNDANTLHHIISPGSNQYIPGIHNESIINSCPLNNNRNHLHKAMHNEEKEKMLLSRVVTILKDKEYRLKKIDKDFISIYKITW
jgi:hypothetical protein